MSSRAKHLGPLRTPRAREPIVSTRGTCSGDPRVAGTRLRIDLLAEDVRRHRGARGVRAAAREIGISPATISRVENHFAPDLATFAKMCRWLKADPWRYLGKARP